MCQYGTYYKIRHFHGLPCCRGENKCSINAYGELRIDNDLKQIVLARFLNVERATYSKYEIGSREPPIPILKQLAKFYNTSVDYLIRRN